LSGVTSNIQTQLDSKSSSSKSFLAGNFGASSVGAGGTASGGFVKSALQSLGNEFQMRTIIPNNCTVKNFTISAGNQPVTGSAVLTLRINETDTAYTLTIAAGSTAVHHQNTTNSLTVPNLSRLTFKIVNNASSNSAVIVAASVMVEI
jgi:hypothetical protein